MVMSLPNGQSSWLASGPPNRTSSSLSLSQHVEDTAASAGAGAGRGRNVTPIPTPFENSNNGGMAVPEPACDPEEESRRDQFAELFRQSEAKIASLFREDGSYNYPVIESWRRPPAPPPPLLPPTTDHAPAREPPQKKVKRAIDEDDYDDDDYEEDGADALATNKIQSASAAAASLLSPTKSGSSPVHSVTADKAPKEAEGPASQDQANASEDARKKLEQDRTATEQTTRRSFWTMFYTLENDRAAMLEQQRLEESEKQLQAEMDNSIAASGANAPGIIDDVQEPGHGTLSSTNLGASSLTLKHLIARIDLKRDQVQASDAELRHLMNEVRKNRSKWASEDSVNQEELYEALDKVLSELKAHTEYSTPFLSRVSKRDAPDYYNLIKQPMDLGSMTKKLKSLLYKSKSEFVVDLNLIWDNCLRYNQDMNHPLRRMANGMRKEAEKLIPLIPDLVIRPRAEVEAEERRKQNGGEDDNGEDSDDEPIMSSRGRTAATKGAKSRQTQAEVKEGTPALDQKPILHLNGHLNGMAKGREGSEAVDGSSIGFGTPPVGSNTPGMHAQSGSNVDAMDIDGPSLNAMALGQAAEQVYEDEEYKIWKQVTKKDRALVARERYQLFKDNRLHQDAPALLRTKAGIRRFLRSQKESRSDGVAASQSDQSALATTDPNKPSETLAEGMEGEAERVIPDYYEPLNTIPDMPTKLQWVEDGEGQVINQHEDYLQLVPPGHFTQPQSRFTKKFDGILRQIQETRKVATRISVVKQMQVQTQVYQNQFPKTTIDPFIERDVDAHFIADNGPIMAPDTCHAALKRSVAKILYYQGFEEFQPSALDTLTAMAADQFQAIFGCFKKYLESDKVEVAGVQAAKGFRWQPRFSQEECVLHCLQESGHDVASLDSYVKDESDKHASKLANMHERMKQHLADLLRPALAADAGLDGVGAFNDGSEQFVSGDFAEDLGEDFFGFRALGLDKEFGLDMMSVPLHLLHSRVRNQYQTQIQTIDSETTDILPQLPGLEPVTPDVIVNHIGLIKDFFLAKLHAANNQPLVEDRDLPVKQRRPPPRLGNTGKIVSPQKRPPKEQIALAKKRKKLEAQAAAAATATNGGPNGSLEKVGIASASGTPAKKLKSISFAAPPGSGPAAAASQNPVLMLAAPKMERIGSATSTGGQSGTGTDRDDGMGGFD